MRVRNMILFAVLGGLLFARPFAVPTHAASPSQSAMIVHGPTPFLQGEDPDTPENRALLAALALSSDGRDISAMLVTHTVYATVSGDEEFRSRFGSAWRDEATNRMEAADNAMFNNFGIDFVLHHYTDFNSANISNPVCTVWSEFASEVALAGADIAVGYIDQSVTGGAGCSGGNHAVVKYQGPSSDWKVSQHEFSHFFGAEDRYPDPSNLHTNDVMEDPYASYDFWCTQSGYNDWGRVNSNSAKYD